MARQLEIDSRRRNRNEYPLNSDFVVPFYGSVVAKNSSTASDPVLNGMIYYSWSNFFLFQGKVQPDSTDSVIIIDLAQTPSPPSTIVNFYNGMAIFMFHQNGTSDFRVITSYDPTTLSLTLQLSSSNVLAGDSYMILPATSSSYVYVNAIDQNTNHVNTMAEAYRGYYVVDETLSYGTAIVGSVISSYNSSLRYLYLQTNLPSNYQPTDSFTIRNTPLLEKWALVDSPYINRDPAFGPVGPVVILPFGASLKDGYYVGLYIYLPQAQPPSVEQSPPVLVTPHTAFRVIAYRVIYDSVTQQYKGNAFVQYDGNAALPGAGAIVNICSFAYDNFVPLNYIGSMVSLTTARCYEVTLVELTLPNVSLISGSRIAFYPYVYVELKNVTSSETASDATTYSNNPDGNRALFIAPVTDIIQPMNSAFVKLGNDMKKIIKFRPNDSFRFSVTLPNGAYFQPQNSDLLSPYPPYNNLQVHAVFSIKPV